MTVRSVPDELSSAQLVTASMLLANALVSAPVRARVAARGCSQPFHVQFACGSHFAHLVLGLASLISRWIFHLAGECMLWIWRRACNSCDYLRMYTYTRALPAAATA